ncbi:hypothetical protein Bbelb_060950 [Branchiostoma belcheri]|nr:hypothetical protein Bbelb_060950 [Branchiostoma belcheri]
MESLPNFYMEEITDADLDEIFGPMEVEEQTLEATPETEVSRVRFACLNEQQLGEIEEGRVEKTTERATKWGVKLLKDLTMQSIYMSPQETVLGNGTLNKLSDKL